MAAIIATEDTEHTDGLFYSHGGHGTRSGRGHTDYTAGDVTGITQRRERSYSGPPCNNGSQASSRGPLSSHTAKR